MFVAIIKQFLKSYLLSFIYLFSLGFNPQLNVSGKTNVPNHIYVSKQKLVLNGAGIRNKYYMDLYVCALYLKTKSKDAKKIMEADEIMGIRIQILSGWVTNKRMQQAIRDGFNKATNNNIKQIQHEIEAIINAFNDEIVKNDVFEMHYTPEQGSLIHKNGTLKCTIKGLEFKQALFGIWLSNNNPNHDELRKQLMGE